VTFLGSGVDDATVVDGLVDPSVATPGRGGPPPHAAVMRPRPMSAAADRPTDRRRRAEADDGSVDRRIDDPRRDIASLPARLTSPLYVHRGHLVLTPLRFCNLRWCMLIGAPVWPDHELAVEVGGGLG
jgi:hypothetical protein